MAASGRYLLLKRVGPELLERAVIGKTRCGDSDGGVISPGYDAEAGRTTSISSEETAGSI